MIYQHARFIKDTRFWLAMMAGPITWALLWLVGLPTEHAGASTATWLYLVLLYPILEEIVFRGGLQSALLTRPGLKKALGPTPLTPANVITSVIFAAFHLLNQPPLWAMLVFLPSLLFGWLRERHDSVLPSIVLHMFYNAGFVALFVSG